MDCYEKEGLGLLEWNAVNYAMAKSVKPSTKDSVISAGTTTMVTMEEWLELLSEWIKD